MGTTITTAQITPQGLLIPREALGNLESQELEIVVEDEAIIIRPKSATAEAKTQVRQILRETGSLYKPEWKTPPSVSTAEREQLAQKAGQGRPLSEIIIEERQDRE